MCYFIIIKIKARLVNKTLELQRSESQRQASDWDPPSDMSVISHHGFTLKGFSIGPRRTLVSTHSLMTEEDQE